MQLRSLFGGNDGAEASPRDRARAYHRLTVHRHWAYARGPHGLDWATQPDPFRRYAGAPLVALEQRPRAGGPSWEQVLNGVQLPSAALDRASISQLFEDSLALTAWKEAGPSRWALRANPSSGNLHPTEGYLVAGPIEGLSERPFVAHYAPREHGLELRAELPEALWGSLSAALPEGGFLLGLSSIHWREAWKYGERAWRYCQLDAGHALGALAVAAAGLGWRAELWDAASSADVAALLGVEGGGLRAPEPEHPDALLVVRPAGGPAPALDPALLDGCARLEWRGAANTLSGGHVDWEIIEEAARATLKPRTPTATAIPEAQPGPRELDGRTNPLRELVAARRSAVAMDRVTDMSREAFFRLLGSTLPRAAAAPLSALPWTPRVHLVLYVHRVRDLAPGLYMLLRDPAALDELRGLCMQRFEWARVSEAPEELALYGLTRGDAQAAAAGLSCNQEIAADGCFSLGMLTEFERPLAEQGAWLYPRLFWEAGLVGQILYLEADALGLRGTGIGCFFDDEVHGMLGLEGEHYQSLYHFTVGGPVEDGRITSSPPYPARG